MKKEANNDNNQISQELWNLACVKWKFKSLWFIPGPFISKMSCSPFKLMLFYILSWSMDILVMFLSCIGMMYMKINIFRKWNCSFSGHVCAWTLRKGTKPNKLFCKKIYQLKGWKISSVKHIRTFMSMILKTEEF